MANKDSEWIRPISIKVISGISVLAFGLGVGYWSGKERGYSSGQESMASDVREGIKLLDAQETLDSLGRNEAEWERANALLAERKPRRAETIIADVRQAFKELGDSIDNVETTESYTTNEIKELAKTMRYSQDIDDFIESHVGKAKLTVKGLNRLKPQVAKIDEMLVSLDRQLALEPSIDLAAFRSVMAEIQSSERAAIASLKARQKTAQLTLQIFETKEKKGSAE